MTDCPQKCKTAGIWYKCARVYSASLLIYKAVIWVPSSEGLCASVKCTPHRYIYTMDFSILKAKLLFSLCSSIITRAHPVRGAFCARARSERLYDYILGARCITRAFGLSKLAQYLTTKRGL